MEQRELAKPVQQIDTGEDFNWGATIAVLVLLLMFIGATFYVLVSSFMEIG